MELKGKRVLVTGSDGFIGSHLTEALLDLGCEVRTFVFYNSFNSWGWLDSLSRETQDQLDVFSGDIRDPNGVRQAMKDVDVVFHLAALIGIPFSYHSPDSYVDTNIKGTLNVLQAARDEGVERTIVTSTSEVYGSAQIVPINEDHPKVGQSPYAATKIGADQLALSFHRSFELPVTVVRPFNTYGPRQSARAVIPTIITQLLDGAKEIKLGALSPTRDMVYVKDTAQGFIQAAITDELLGEEVNIATGGEISIGDLANKIIKVTGKEASIVSDEQRIRPEGSEVDRLCGDVSKLKDASGWSPEYDFDRGLEETIKWFSDKENRRGYRSHVYNV